MPKDFLVHISSEGLARLVMEAAVSLTMTRNARLRAVSVGPIANQPFGKFAELKLRCADRF